MPASKRAPLLILCLFAVQGLNLCSSPAGEPVVGLVKQKPSSGRFVETELGYMVPYSMKIPGTEATYSMVPVPGGRFQLGSPDSEAKHRQDEGPQVEVAMEPYWIGKYEVSWAEYKEFMKLYAVFKEFETRQIRSVTDDNRADAITAPTELYDPSFTFEYGEEPEQPAVTMTQYAAKQYTKWVSAVTGHQYRLPSEAEWEYACRAGSKTAYHFGDDPQKLGDYAWYYANADEMPHAVGTKMPNAWGIHDMHGNVWEWVLDEYFEDGYKRLGNKPTSASHALAWPTKLFPRVVRGGSWDEHDSECRSSVKMPSHDTDWKSEDPNLPLSPWWYTSDPARSVGFRYVRSLRTIPADKLARYWRADVEEVQFDVQSRIDEGRGALGIVDRALPDAIRSLEAR